MTMVLPMKQYKFY